MSPWETLFVLYHKNPPLSLASPINDRQRVLAHIKRSTLYFNPWSLPSTANTAPLEVEDMGRWLSNKRQRQLSWQSPNVCTYVQWLTALHLYRFTWEDSHKLVWGVQCDGDAFMTELLSCLPPPLDFCFPLKWGSREVAERAVNRWYGLSGSPSVAPQS